MVKFTVGCSSWLLKFQIAELPAAWSCTLTLHSTRMIISVDSDINTALPWFSKNGCPGLTGLTWIPLDLFVLSKLPQSKNTVCLPCPAILLCPYLLTFIFEFSDFGIRNHRVFSIGCAFVAFPAPPSHFFPGKGHLKGILRSVFFPFFSGWNIVGTTLWRMEISFS